MRQSLSIAAAVMSLAAAWISFELLAKHVTGKEGPALFAALCTDQPNSRMNCDAVLRSPYSVFPPQKPGRPPTDSVPVAFLGLVYYSALSCWFIAVGAVSRQRRHYHLIPLTLLAFGVLGSFYYSWIMFTRLNEWCPWCAITHGLNVLIALCAVLLWPRATAPAASAAAPRAPSASPPVDRPYPSHHLALVAVGLMVAVFYAQRYMFRSAVQGGSANVHKQNFDGCMAEINRLLDDGNALIFAWMQAPKHEMPIRKDDAVHILAKDTEFLVPVTIFSDFQCLSCRRAARFVEEKAQPMFEGRLAVVFRHYPIDAACNPHTQANSHPRACEAARWVEAARIFAGPTGFKKAHDYIFGNQELLTSGAMTGRDVALLVGADPVAFLVTANSEEITQRIREDIEQAVSLKIGGTPAVFFQGRQVDKLAVRSTGFWDKLAEQYWHQRQVPRPEHTKRTAEPAAGDTSVPSEATSPDEPPQARRNAAADAPQPAPTEDTPSPPAAPSPAAAPPP